LGQVAGLKVDPGREEPLYRQIFDQVVARIQARTFPPGYKLPPSRVLARELSTHRNTIARAYADLEAAGFVSSTVGRGTFVSVQRSVPSTPSGPLPAGSGSIPWNSLVSRVTRSEAFGRTERFARRVEGRDVINLARMQPSLDLLPDALLRRCLERVLVEQGARALAYADPGGVVPLRQQIADDLSLRGVPATAEDILVTSGSQQALDLIARALVNPGDTVLVDAMTYSGAIDLFTLAGARLVSVPSDGEGPDVAALQRLSRAEVKALYLMPNGHNPTGLTISSERRHSLVEWSRGAGIPLIEDDYAAGLELDPQEAMPFLRALDGDVIHVSTFSKRLIPALRIGFAVCPRPLRPVLCSVKRAMDLGTSSVLQHALAEFMERGYLRAHMNRILPEYRARRDALDAALRKHLPAEVRWNRPRHGVVLWLRLPHSVEPEAIYEEALRQGVQVSPSPLWSVEARADWGLRLTFCAEPSERLTEGARRLGKAFKTLTSRTPRKTDRAAPAIEVV
jgi:2-aminoadipate transaminase